MRQELKRLPRYRLYVLGAGFSKPAGVPLAHELWHEVERRARNLPKIAHHVVADLEEYLEFKRDCDGKTLQPGEVDFEDFLAFLDVEYYLGLRGSDTWSADGNEAQVIVKTLIGQVLAEAMPTVDDVPELYMRFAAGLQPGDHVLTFNYDILLERALDAVGKAYRLFPSRYESVSPGSAVVDDSRDEVVVLKMHGSIDWFDRTSHTRLEEHWRDQGSVGGPRDPVFSHEERLGVEPLLEGPRFPDDGLREMYRVRRVEDLYREFIFLRCTPWLLNPSAAKLLFLTKLGDFFHGLGGAGTLNFGLTIIGFSLAPHDEYARQIIYRLVTNYQRQYWNDGAFGMKKTPLLLIDKRESAAEKTAYRERYSFVDWNRAELYLQGLDDRAVELALRPSND